MPTHLHAYMYIDIMSIHIHTHAWTYTHVLLQLNMRIQRQKSLSCHTGFQVKICQIFLYFLAYRTWYFQAITHPNTNQIQCCSTFNQNQCIQYHMTVYYMVANPMHFDRFSFCCVSSHMKSFLRRNWFRHQSPNHASSKTKLHGASTVTLFQWTDSTKLLCKVNLKWMISWES